MVLALDASNAGDVAEIAKLNPVYSSLRNWAAYTCDTYQDAAGKFYYSKDGGATFFDDVSDMNGSIVDTTTPGYQSFVNGLTQLNAHTMIYADVDVYNDPQTGMSYYSPDGGRTFCNSNNALHLEKPAFDSANPADQAIIARMTRVISTASEQTTFIKYYDPVTKQIYYGNDDRSRNTFISNINTPDRIALDSANPDQKNIIDRLVYVPCTVGYNDKTTFPEKYLVYEDGRNGHIYYSYDGGQTFTTSVSNPYNNVLQQNTGNQTIIANLRPFYTTLKKTEKVTVPSQNGDGAGIQTQEAAQKALTAIDRAIVSKDRIRGSLGALQNRLENTITNLAMQGENLQAAESRISDVDVATEMTRFVREQVLTQSAVQANSYPHMLMTLLQS